MSALILSFIIGSIAFVWLHVVFTRNGIGKGMSMLYSSTISSVVSSVVYYAVDALF
ncbi:MAG: hypothetical protein HQK91_01615 [Nitrospirae bacterium]|nr:hypothetical protein [Nitrospirota bacterium]